MVAYASGETEFLTLGQMVDRRAVAWRAPDRPAPLPREQAALPPSGVRSGQRAVHRVFGPGTVLSFRDPIVEIRFPAKGGQEIRPVRLGAAGDCCALRSEGVPAFFQIQEIPA